jgi:hypothetical protein
MDDLTLQARLSALESIVEYLLALEMVRSDGIERIERALAQSRAEVRSLTGEPTPQDAARAAENALADIGSRARATAEKMQELLAPEGRDRA